MNILQLIPFSLSLFLSLSVFGQSKGMLKESEKITVNFTNEYQFSDLAKVKEELANEGITLQYNKIEFNDDYKLSYISFDVDCKDHYEGSASSAVDDKTTVGFYRNYSQDAKSAFGTGTSHLDTKP